MKHHLFCLSCKRKTPFVFDVDGRVCVECGIGEGVDAFLLRRKWESSDRNTQFQRKLNEKQIKELFGGGTDERLKSGSG